MNVVETRVEGKVGWITLNRPKKLNALSAETVSMAYEVVQKFQDDDDISVIVIEGANNNFSVGYDIAEEVEAGIARPEDWHAALTNNVALSMSFFESKKPTIAAVDGWCLAGACELAMCCDMIIATDRAQFGEPEIRFGSGPVTMVMPFVLGQKKTMELLLTGDVVDAEAALSMGMINTVVVPDDLTATVTKLANKIALTPLVTLRFTKLTLNRAYQAMGMRRAVDANLDIAATLNAAYSPEKAEFGELVKTKGLRAALNYRDERYGNLS